MRKPTDPRAGTAPEAQRAVPFDYTFRFDLKGIPNRVVRSIVTVSVEASFTAVSIGYGVVPRITPIVFGPSVSGSVFVASIPFPGGGPGSPTLRSINFGDVIDALEQRLAQTPAASQGETALEAALRGGIRLNPQFAEAAFLDRAVFNSDVTSQLFQVVSAPADEIQFLYALFDEGSGREFQSEPLLNTAGLGISNGDRPFRYFARPITFAPRSTIRMEITEKSDFQGELHVSLHGYKVLGSPGTPTSNGQATRRRARRR